MIGYNQPKQVVHVLGLLVSTLGLTGGLEALKWGPCRCPEAMRAVIIFNVD